MLKFLKADQLWNPPAGAVSTPINLLETKSRYTAGGESKSGVPVVFIYVKVVLAVIFSWLLYAAVVEALSSASCLMQKKNFMYVDEQLGERAMVFGKDTKKIVSYLCQHVFFAITFALAIFLLLS